MNVIEHEHPLKLVDLQMIKDPKEEDSEEESNDEEEIIAPDDVFVCSCNRCYQEIKAYYRYYYKCTNDSCDYSLHKFCAELPTTIEHALHPFPLEIFHEKTWSWTCSVCRRRHMPGRVCYQTPYHIRLSNLYIDDFYIDVNCAVEVEKKKIQHPSHPHPLVSLVSEPILCKCSACGKEHKGTFLHCTTCSNFAIHNDCASLPKSLLIQHTTDNTFHHTHPLVLSYSISEQELREKYYPNCRVCDGYFEFKRLWIYKCERCIYYTHLDCATSRGESFMSILSSAANGPTTYTDDKISLYQINHQHEIFLVDIECIDIFGPTSSKINNSSIKFHDPMKKVELLCNVCLRPIMEMPFYKCTAYEDEGCNFTLHEWCTRLPIKVENHPGHPKHTLLLMSNVPPDRQFSDRFRCRVCSLLCNGYGYGCVTCKFYVDITCGLMPKNITHKSHPNHLLRVKYISASRECLMCRSNSGLERHLRGDHQLVYSCDSCDVYIHSECALLLPETINIIYDKHPMHLSYQPIENHKSEYFCEVCEEKLNPHYCFYHCDECSQSVHSACADSLIFRPIKKTYDHRHRSIYEYINVKSGSIQKDS
ncbi:hypothetical protein R6Q57_009837 [Mikania cordata]